jgi:hypothetical protein
MVKVQGFLSQEVLVTRKPSPDSEDQTVNLPPEYKALLEKIIRYFNNFNYPTWATSFLHLTRSAKARNAEKTYLPDIKPLWAALSAETKELWKQSAAFVKRSGYQLFVKDCCYRMKNGLECPRDPSVFFQMFGLKVSNPDGASECRFQRDDVLLTGPITISFNYKKFDYGAYRILQETLGRILLETGDCLLADSSSNSFRFEVTAWYFEAGENKTETLSWESPVGNVDWTAVEESFGTADRLYYHFRIVFYVDYLNMDIYFTDFLIQDKNRSWSVDYIGNCLPENAAPAWSKTGSFTTIKSIGKRLHLLEEVGSENEVKWTRTPTFINSVGSTVYARLRVDQGYEKQAGEDAWAFKIIHSDGTYRIDLLFYTNGFALKIGDIYHVYHEDMTKLKTIRSFIIDNMVHIYLGTKEVYREELSGSGAAEVSFGAQGLEEYPTEVWLAELAYFSGEKSALEDEVYRQGFWILAGEEWVVDNLYRKTGWTFVPDYAVPYFDLVYLPEI